MVIVRKNVTVYLILYCIRFTRGYLGSEDFFSYARPRPCQVFYRSFCNSTREVSSLAGHWSGRVMIKSRRHNIEFSRGERPGEKKKIITIIRRKENIQRRDSSYFSFFIPFTFYP